MGFMVRMTLAARRPWATRTAVLGRRSCSYTCKSVRHVRSVTEDLTEGDRVDNRLRRSLPGVR